MVTIYDTIGDTYSQTRRADARIVQRIEDLLGLPTGARILDVGAGSGNYSLALADRGFEITSLEPSAIMAAQASDHPHVSWVTGSAENLPFDSGSFDAAILILCIHHFSDLERGLAEAQRVVVAGGPILIFTYDPSAIDAPWLFSYLPAFRDQIREFFPSISSLRSHLAFRSQTSVHTFPLPDDLRDAFVGAAWKYPERYLDQGFRDGTSAFRLLDPKVCKIGLDQLRGDLQSGAWDEKYSKIRSLAEYDHGYIFLVARGEAD